MSAKHFKRWVDVAMLAGIPYQLQLRGLSTGYASATWKVRLIEDDFFRLMFEMEGV